MIMRNPVRCSRGASLLFILCSATMMFAAGDGLDPAAIAKPLGESWPTYSGDYSGRRYSALTQINQTNIRTVTLAFVSKLAAGPGGGGGFGPQRTRTTVGGEGTGEVMAT